MSLDSRQDHAVQALDSRFQERRQQVPVLGQRAAAEGITEIRALEDMVPVLFPHTTYKSYPESLIAKGRWAQMNRWLDSLSARRVDVDVDVDGVGDVDGWMARLHAAGHMVSTSSGTTGKSSFLNKSRRDWESSLGNMVDSLRWKGIEPEPVWHVIPGGPRTGQEFNDLMRETLLEHFARPDAIPHMQDTDADGHHAAMAWLSQLRRAVANGTASPDEIATFQAESAERQRILHERLAHFAREILDRREERFLFSATFPMMFQLAEILRELGARPGDICGRNALTTGGGLKGITLPEDYRDQIADMLDIDATRLLHYYSMQEINIRMPKCLSGRYHVPDGLVLFVLDREGEALAPVSDGQAEGRAAYFDLTVDGRWGGTMSGDRVVADFGTCSCGRPGPTIFDDIVRFADLPDDDKITCAGTLNAYVRDFVGE